MGHQETFGADLSDLDSFKTANVLSLNNFPDPVGVVLTLHTGNPSYIFAKSLNSSTFEVVVPANSSVTFDSTNTVDHVWTTEIATGKSFISGDIAELAILGLDLDSVNGGECFTLNAGAGVIPLLFGREFRISGFDSLGTIDGIGVVLENIGYVSNGGGWTFNDVSVLSMAEQNFVLQGGDHITITGSLIHGFINTILATPASGDAVFNISSSLTVTGRIMIDTGAVDLSNGGTMFDAGGKDQTDPAVFVKDVLGTPNSCWTGSMGFEENATETTISTINTYVDIAGTFAAGYLERTTHSAGVLTNAALEMTRDEVTVDVSASNALSAANRMIRVAILVDYGSGYVNEGSQSFSINGNTMAISFSRVLSSLFKTGYKIKAQIKNETNTDNILVKDINVTRRRIC